jgi:leucyl aminopeptidase
VSRHKIRNENMQADIFYQITRKKTRPLVLITQAECTGDSSHLDTPVRQCMRLQQFKGQLGEICFLDDGSEGCSTVLIGSGTRDDALAIAHAVNHLPEGSYHETQPLSFQARLVWSLAQYRFDRYKQHKAFPRRLALDASDLDAVQCEAQAIFLVRDLINTPTNDMGPAELASVMAELAHKQGAEFKQWIGDDLLKENFPAIHAVGRASTSAPRLLELTWGNPAHPKVSLIGKGVCFDSGGLDLKSSSNMRLMKKDMGGAAQAIGLASLLMDRKAPLRLQVLIPAVENAVGSNAYRPGDILTMRNGLTVEIDNTDAEGRLVVADALVKACEDQPDLIIDFTTLTGAARVAVGTDISAMFSNNDALAEGITRSALTVNDPVWRMPLFAGYASMLDSSIADLVNSSPSSYAGAITAALFLQRFVVDDCPWVHFDLMAWNVSNKPGKPEGGEAMGIRAVADYLLGRFGS